jgi:hypothetical protein
MRRLIAALTALAVSVSVSLAYAQAIRPAPLTLVRPAAPAPGVCAEATRASFVAGFPAQLDAVMNYGQAVGAYGERLADWKGQRLIELGAWTDEDHGAFALGLLEDDGFMGFLNTSMAEVGGMAQSAAAYGEALEAGDEAAACDSAIEALRAADRIVDSAAAQWAYMHARYDAEAAAHGVSLE